MLVRSAHSANIKERRDASTALFDADGQMVMQAEHIPVHLGAMPSAVAAVLGEEHAAGRAWVLNDPYRGRHAPARHHRDHAALPRRRELLGFAASRAHHADVGGREPGQHARRLAHARGRGRGDPAHPARRRGARASSPAACAARASARPTCAPSSPPAAPARERRGRADRAVRARRPARRRSRRRSTTPSGARAPASPSSTDGARERDATCSRRADGDLELQADARRSTATR